jgi:hypothetical protein
MSISPNNPNAQAYQIPLVNTPQTFQIPLAGVTYTMTSKWNDMGGFWALDIADSSDNMIVANVPLITGADCLAGLDYLGFEGSLYVITSGNMPDAVPTLDNLGIDSFLYFVTLVTANG